MAVPPFFVITTYGPEHRGYGPQLRQYEPGPRWVGLKKGLELIRGIPFSLSNGSV